MVLADLTPIRVSQSGILDHARDLAAYLTWAALLGARMEGTNACLATLNVKAWFMAGWVKGFYPRNVVRYDK